MRIALSSLPSHPQRAVATTLPPECASLPACTQELLQTLLTQAASLTRSRALWVEAPLEALDAEAREAWRQPHAVSPTPLRAPARDSFQQAVVQASYAALQLGSGASEPVSTAYWLLSRVARVAVDADLAPAGVARVLQPWWDGSTLADWAESAPSLQVEIARVLLPDWSGSLAEIPGAAEALVAPS